MDHLLTTGGSLIHDSSSVAPQLGFICAEEDQNEGESERLNKLATFQLKMIQHAMTCETYSILNGIDGSLSLVQFLPCRG